KGDADDIFAITNDISRWPELFKEYRGATILDYERKDRFARIDFELVNEEGAKWQSLRILDFTKRIAIAQRCEPKFPFVYMHLTWTYESVEDGVRMTWNQAFEVDPKAPFTNEQAVVNMVNHMKDNQIHFKEVLEALPSTK
ncbi:MAG TPA: SRPBCC family protein, partial [Ktedonobacteraceae bacterium]|nr:SRPBCC family protein [Ktedonobacteraceae bacterium]